VCVHTRVKTKNVGDLFMRNRVEAQFS